MVKPLTLVLHTQGFVPLHSSTHRFDAVVEKRRHREDLVTVAVLAVPVHELVKIRLF